MVVDVSGGLDSASVATTMASMQRSQRFTGECTAFSLKAGRSPDADESRFQDEVVAECGWPQVSYDFDEQASIGDLQLQYSPLPNIEWFWGGVLAGMRETIRRSAATVRLTGFGGDALFASRFPPLDLADSLRAGRLRELFTSLRGHLAVGDRSLWNLLRRCCAGDISAPLCLEPLRPPKWLRKPVRRAIRDTHYAFPAQRLTFESPGKELQYRILLRQTAGIRSATLLQNERHPLLAPRMVKFALNLPWEHKIRPGRDRVLQRRAMKGQLPETIRLRRSKTGVGSLVHRETSRVWPRLSSHIGGDRLADLGIVEPRLFRQAAERYRHGLSGLEHSYIVAALSLEIWLGMRRS